MTVLVVAAHPDDEVLGVGGSVARHAQAGRRVASVILAEGATSRSDRRSTSRHRDDLRELRRAARAAADILGSEPPVLHDLPDNRMDGLELLDLVKLIEREVERVKPSLVYTHSAVDVNVDHRRVHDAVLAATRPTPDQPVREIRFFETPSSTEWAPPPTRGGFAPTVFVDVGDTLELKCAALAEYTTEMRPWPHPRSIEAITALARWRGASVGISAAEAFESGRRVILEDE